MTCCQFGIDGGWLEKIIIIAVGSAATNMVTQPNLIRVFVGNTAIVNNTATTVNNTRLLVEHVVPLTTIPVANTTTAGTYRIEIPLNIPIDAGDYIHVAQTATTTANTQWQVCVIGGNFS